jgi:hypothetical protein
LGAAGASAADVSAGADLYSAYIWRGITLNDSPVAQPWLDVSGIKIAKGVSLGANVWTNVDIGDWNGTLRSGEVSEIDLMLTLSLPKGFKAGYVEYTFPVTVAGTGLIRSGELFAGWSGAKVVSLSANVYYDVDEYEDWFATLALGKEVALNAKTSLALEALAGYAGKDFAVAYRGSEGGLYHYNLSAKLNHKATDKLTVSATAGYTRPFDEKRLPKQDASLYAGVNLKIGL